jgi:hypothetical protein
MKVYASRQETILEQTLFFKMQFPALLKTDERDDRAPTYLDNMLRS